ncbi:hypothetical protein BHF69_08570 [Anaerostipes sp. 992a]|uniref:CpsD/CapB family tyrosine-protein kinase n=1 Tax=Anaerostipes sp. 992a TaxID=1261637 RepID=UPI000951CB46|nr:CpsD/CapB family tyrosine-protein kinase [Anaerostipes sp. 992a]OLR62726.1 hypothetical protein BHF69_08570 [Anaerostipes sp. 992a]
MNKVTLGKIQDQEYEIVEAFRTIKTNIQFCGANIKTIMVTSSVADEGKSVVAFHLARSLAESNKRVLYVDCDIRRSVTIGRLGAYQENGKSIFGLSHYLSEQKTLKEIIYSTTIENVDMIFTGPDVPNPTELLEGPLFQKLVEEVKGEYDKIIFDTPPLGMVIDAAVIGPCMDGAILVVRQGKVNRRMIKKVKKQLEHSGVRILGGILNGKKYEKQGYYYKSGYYQSY